MSLPAELQLIAGELHTAVDRRDFAAAAKATVRFVEKLRSASRSVSAWQSCELLTEGSRSIEIARRNICAAQARMRARLRRIEQTSQYQAPLETTKRRWRIDA